MTSSHRFTLARISHCLHILTQSLPYAPPWSVSYVSSLQRVRDWVHDFFSSVIRFCEDASDKVAAAAFSAIDIPLGALPLCCTTVHQQLRSYWGHEGEWLNDCSAASGLRFNHHKQVRLSFSSEACCRIVWVLSEQPMCYIGVATSDVTDYAYLL